MRLTTSRPTLRGAITALALVTIVASESGAYAESLAGARQEDAVSATSSSVGTAIASVLDASAAAWSRGDLDGFMACYETGPDTLYLKADGPVRGYAAIRSMYATRFRPHGRGMGVLSTRLSDVRPLGSDYALVVGSFRLARVGAEGHDGTGVFTLVFHRSPEGWRIISDHTS